MICRFVDIGGIVDHHCLEVIVRLLRNDLILVELLNNLSRLSGDCFRNMCASIVDIGGIVDHHCLEVIVRFFDIGGIVDHDC